MESADSTIQLPHGPESWPPSAAWPAAVHTGVGKLKAEAQRWGLEANGPPILVGVSGGADSLALAVVAAETQRVTGLQFGAVILDHQLQQVTAAVAQRTAQLCRTLGLAPVLTDTLEITEQGDGLEAAARQARYDAFVRLAARARAAGVLTAHTANDQAEQVLLGLARGSGLRSLAGIRNSRQHVVTGYEPVEIGRPLLSLTRDDTEAVCLAGIQYFQDPMNDDLSLLRNSSAPAPLTCINRSGNGLGPEFLAVWSQLPHLPLTTWTCWRNWPLRPMPSSPTTATTIHFPLRQMQDLKPAPAARRHTLYNSSTPRNHLQNAYRPSRIWCSHRWGGPPRPDRSS